MTEHNFIVTRGDLEECVHYFYHNVYYKNFNQYIFLRFQIFSLAIALIAFLSEGYISGIFMYLLLHILYVATLKRSLQSKIIEKNIKLLEGPIGVGRETALKINDDEFIIKRDEVTMIYKISFMDQFYDNHDNFYFCLNKSISLIIPHSANLSSDEKAHISREISTIKEQGVGSVHKKTDPNVDNQS